MSSGMRHGVVCYNFLPNTRRHKPKCPSKARNKSTDTTLINSDHQTYQQFTIMPSAHNLACAVSSWTCRVTNACLILKPTSISPVSVAANIYQEVCLQYLTELSDQTRNYASVQPTLQTCRRCCICTTEFIALAVLGSSQTPLYWNPECIRNLQTETPCSAPQMWLLCYWTWRRTVIKALRKETVLKLWKWNLLI